MAINPTHPRLRQFWRNEVVRFLAVGMLNTAFGYGVYILCLLLLLPYRWALGVSTVTGVVFNFFTTGSIVFSNTGMGRVVGFFLGYCVTFALNLWLLTLLVERGFNKALGQGLILPIVVSASYLINKHLVFGVRR